MEALLERCLQGRRPTVLVMGDVMCDVYLWGKISRISPEAPVPVFSDTERHQALGGAANAAANLRALGCDVRLLGVVGADAAGRRVRELLHQQDIADTWLLEDATRPTTEKTRLIAQHQHVLRLDHESQAPLMPPMTAQLLTHARSLMAEIDGVVCSDYDKGVCIPSLLRPLFAEVQAAGRPILVDPKAQDFARYRGASVLIPNLAEAERGSGIALETVADLERAADNLLHQSEAQALLVTRGKEGMSLFYPPEAPLHIPARAREVFDVTGAGDTVAAAFGMAMLSGLSMAEAARLANIAAGIAVGKIGTAAVSLSELLAAVREDALPRERKVLPRDELAVVLQRHRQRGEKIVSTNGCFDLLHVGHIHYLQQARSLGDLLVVGLNDDASVRRLKGQGRPLIPQEERARILAALSCVDYVTFFGEATPVALLEILRPDIHVKGGDYTMDQLVERDVVEAHGGKVHILPYLTGVSTTGIIDSIVERHNPRARGY